MYSFFSRHHYNFSQGIKYNFPVENIYTAVNRKSRFSKNILLSIGILIIFISLPIPVKAHLTSKKLPIVISETPSSEMLLFEVIAQRRNKITINSSIPSSKDSGRPLIPRPIPTTSPSIPQIPENIPEIPQESPGFSPVEDIQPSKPTSDVPDDIPHPVPSNNLPSSAPETSSSGNILEVAAVTSSLNIFARAIEAADLTDALMEDFFTIFAPTNDAFSASLPPGAMEFLLRSENKYLLQRLLRYHIVKGEFAANELTTGKINTLGGSIAIRVTPQRIILNNSSITHPDIPATNGLIHSINRVLIPRNLRNAITTKMSGKSNIKER